jgi:hypothetical protein
MDLDSTSMGQEHSAMSLGLLALTIGPASVDLNQYQWLLSPSKGQQESTLELGLASHRQAFDTFRQSCEMEAVRMTGALIISPTGVSPAKLAKESRPSSSRMTAIEGWLRRDNKRRLTRNGSGS